MTVARTGIIAPKKSLIEDVNRWNEQAVLFLAKSLAVVWITYRDE
jgi:hypothetical protein